MRMLHIYLKEQTLDLYRGQSLKVTDTDFHEVAI